MVTDCGNDWDICVDKSAHLLVPKIADFVPTTGMKAKFYGKGAGHTIRGVVIDDIVFYYKTSKQQEQYHQRQIKEQNKKEKEEFKLNKNALDKKFKALPRVFQQRIQRFRDHNPNFRWKYESYEMFVCEEAVKIAETLKTIRAITKWSKNDWKKQKTLVNISDNHSGNTFACAVFLAKLYANKSPNVIEAHGALTPLVGCEEYGCFHPKIS